MRIRAALRRAALRRVSNAKISEFLQDTLRTRHLDRVSAVEAARWLDAARILLDEPEKPGLPLRKRLRERDGSIIGARQEPNKPNGRWYIYRVTQPERRYRRAVNVVVRRPAAAWEPRARGLRRYN
jgi:hypothetical protein